MMKYFWDQNDVANFAHLPKRPLEAKILFQFSVTRKEADELLAKATGKPANDGQPYCCSQVRNRATRCNCLNKLGANSRTKQVRIRILRCKIKKYQVRNHKKQVRYFCLTHAGTDWFRDFSFPQIDCLSACQYVIVGDGSLKFYLCQSIHKQCELFTKQRKVDDSNQDIINRHLSTKRVTMKEQFYCFLVSQVN